MYLCGYLQELSDQQELERIKDELVVLCSDIERTTEKQQELTSRLNMIRNNTPSILDKNSKEIDPGSIGVGKRKLDFEVSSEAYYSRLN
jgi:hypothetical protein